MKPYTTEEQLLNDKRLMKMSAYDLGQFILNKIPDGLYNELLGLGCRGKATVLLSKYKLIQPKLSLSEKQKKHIAKIIQKELTVFYFDNFGTNVTDKISKYLSK